MRRTNDNARLVHLADERNKANLAKLIKPIPLPANPKLTTSDVSIICPTIDTPSAFTHSLGTWLINEPREIIIVTIARDLTLVQNLMQLVIAEFGLRRASTIRVLVADYASKRAQMVMGIRHATGKIIVNVDDDIYWGDETLTWLLAPMEKENVGACVGRKV